MNDVDDRLRLLRGFGAFRRALRNAETVDAVAEATERFATVSLGCKAIGIYCAARDEEDFRLLAGAGVDLPEVIERASAFAQRVLLEEGTITDAEPVLGLAATTGATAVALALRDTPAHLIGILLVAGPSLDPEVLSELAFDLESVLSARITTQLRAEELAMLEVQERELVGLLRDVEARDAIIQRDLEEARDFQRTMLGAPPVIDRAAVEVVYRPLGLVGGDLYAVSLHGDRLRLFIADATGHGVRASLTTMFIKSGYDAVRAAAPEPVALLEALNDGIAQTYKSSQMLFSAACVDLDLSTGVLAYASAAHPPFCVVRGAEAELVEAFGAFLGLRSRMRFETKRTKIERGDGVYLVTDGFSETLGASGAQFGEELLRQTILDAHRIGAPPGKALDDAVVAFSATGELTDDATFVGARFAPR